MLNGKETGEIFLIENTHEYFRNVSRDHFSHLANVINKMALYIYILDR